MTTLGKPKGDLNFETKRPKERNIKGKKMVLQEKIRIKKSLRVMRMSPCLAKETIIRPAREKKVIWAIENVVAGLSFNLKALLFLTLLIVPFATTIHYILILLKVGNLRAMSMIPQNNYFKRKLRYFGYNGLCLNY